MHKGRRNMGRTIRSGTRNLTCDRDRARKRKTNRITNGNKNLDNNMDIISRRIRTRDSLPDRIRARTCVFIASPLGHPADLLLVCLFAYLLAFGSSKFAPWSLLASSLRCSGAPHDRLGGFRRASCGVWWFKEWSRRLHEHEILYLSLIHI